MRLSFKNKLWHLKKTNNGFAIPQVLILGVGVAIAVSGLMSASILSLTGSKIKRQELISKASSYSGVTILRSLLNDSSQKGLFHYFWLINSGAERSSEYNNFVDPVPNPSQEYWSDDEWCKGSNNCFGRQKAPVCTPGQQIDWRKMISSYSTLFQQSPISVAENSNNSRRDFNQVFNFISTKYIGTEKNGTSSMLLEGLAMSNNENEQTASNKLRVNIKVISETPEEGFGFLSIGENQLDSIADPIGTGPNSLFLGNLNITPTSGAKGSIIWRRNLDANSECDNLIEEAKGNGSSLPEVGNGGIWVQPLGLPKQPRLSNVDDIGILICTPKVIQREGTSCQLDAGNSKEKVYRIHSLYVKGPGSKFEISTRNDSKIILEIMGDIDISNGGIFCHKDGLNSCGTGKAENLTILFKQKTTIEGNKIVCNNIDEFPGGGVRLINNVDFTGYQYPINNNQLPGSSFLIDNTGENESEEFGAFVYGPKTTFLSVLPDPESQWVQVTNSEERNNSAGMIVTTRGSYGWIKNTLGESFKDKMVSIVLTPNGKIIPYLGQKTLSVSNDDESIDIEIIGVGNKIDSLPIGSKLNPSADKVFLIYDKSSQSYYLRTFDVINANPENQISSEFSYPRAFAKMNARSDQTHIELTEGIESSESINLLEIFNIKLQKSTPTLVRNFSGATWVKTLCFDSNGQKNWRFSKEFIDKLRLRHGDNFNYGVRYYKGRSIILWDNLRDFNS
tara:strand:+ start:242 stop:2440 length:2199 start_codon:yes stop_codon:yes gene_type:complete